MDWNVALLQALDFPGVDVDTDDVIADFGKTCTRNQTDVAGAEYRNAHVLKSD